LGGFFTLGLILLPHTPLTFSVALAGEYLFQAIAFSIQVGIMFETIGENNPLAATTFTILSAATYVPITYMMVADGNGYSLGGVAWSLGVDATSITTCWGGGDAQVRGAVEISSWLSESRWEFREA
jgi:MFS transporter, PAT family, beta-lactamase induction signal transducer AmpG